MNYSQAEIKRRRKEITSASRKMKYRIEEWVAYGSVILVITLLLILIFGMAGAVRGMIDSTPDLTEIDILAKGNASILYDSTGQEIQTLSTDDIIQEYVPVSEIPKCVQEAFIAIEDKRFYAHHGVDMQGLIHSIYSNVTGKGRAYADSANTITQRLIQNQIFGGTGGNNFVENFCLAVQKQHLATQLEDYLDKSKILEYYLNTINLGSNIVGVQAASRRYFDKNITDVNFSEAAVLAAMAEDPSEYSPIANQEKNGRRRRSVLKNMLDEGYISEDEYEQALGDDVYLRVMNADSSNVNSGNKTNSYYADAVVEQVIQDLKRELGYSQTEAYNALYYSGLRIFTCQESSLQKICDDVINSDRFYPTTVRSYLSYHLTIVKDGREQEFSEVDIKNYFLEKEDRNISLYFKKTSKAKEYVRKFREAMLKDGGLLVTEDIQLVKQPQASFVLMEQSSGKVKAIAGGRGQKAANLEINRATELKRQPGSALAMLSTYAPALDTAGFTLGDIQDDAAYRGTGLESAVWNGQNSAYDGLLTLRTAIKKSKSIPAIRTLQEISVQTGYDFLKKFGFTTIVERKENAEGNVYSDLQLKLALGELNEGVTNLELTAAYAAIANGGVYQRPRFYTRILDKDGNVLLENNVSSKRIIKKDTAWLLTDSMKDVMQKGGGKIAGFRKIQTETAGNYAITAENTDFWFEGYTPYYTAGIWSGADENTSQGQSDYYMVIWREIMEKVHRKTKKLKQEFKRPESIVMRRICNKCGNLAVHGLCDEAEGGNTVYKEYFALGTEPDKNCTCHVKYAFCKKSGKLAGEMCPKDEMYYRILLQKQETAETADTPNTVAHNIGKDICDVHTSSE